MNDSIVDLPEPVTPRVVTLNHKDYKRIGARPNFFQYLAELWSYRKFIVAYARARVSVTNADYSLGSVWLLLAPVLNGLTFYLVFGLMLQTGRGVPNFVAYLIIGVFVFRFTSISVATGARSLVSGKALASAFKFPRATLPLVANTRELFAIGPTYVMMVILVLVFPPLEPLTIWWLVLIPVTGLQFLFNTGISIILSRWVVQRYDLMQLINVGLRVWMYLSAVFFSIERFEKHSTIHLVMQLNPAYCFLDIARQGMLYGQLASWLSWTVAISSSILFFVIGMFYFWQGEEKYGRLS